MAPLSSVTVRASASIDTSLPSTVAAQTGDVPIVRINGAVAKNRTMIVPPQISIHSYEAIFRLARGLKRKCTACRPGRGGGQPPHAKTGHPSMTRCSQHALCRLGQCAFLVLTDDILAAQHRR